MMNFLELFERMTSRMFVYMTVMIVVCFQPSVISQNVPESNELNGGESELGGSSGQYRIHIGDLIEMKVLQEAELTRLARVDKDGTANLPLIGDVYVIEASVQQAADRIRKLYMKEYLVNPLVSVTVAEFGKSNFTILGQVKRPGYYLYPSNTDINLLQAIAMGGGYTRIGSPSKITIKRVVAGKEQVVKLNGKQMAKEESSKIVAIRSGDTVSIGESLF
jgi:protein involved in polysaccharide export with SLBB domain